MPLRPFHEGCLKALRAASTARSTSSAVAAKTEQISSSVLHGTSVEGGTIGEAYAGPRSCSYEGFMEVIFCSLLDLTNSPLIRRPKGWDHFFPLGAVSSTSMVATGFV